jgi:DNA-binding transcriptional LysR family regulator
MGMDRFVGMAVFVRVVEEGSFAAAARHFGLSPAMASKHVQALEQRLGARLLNRTTRRVSPTEIGRDYCERARRILADLDEADRAAEDQQAAPRGQLRVSASYTFGVGHVAPAIADYLAAYADVSVDLVLNDRHIDLIEDGFDVAVRIGQLPDSSLIARRLAPVRLVLCASPAYVARHGAPRRPQDLTAHNCLVYTYAASRDEWRFTGPDGRPEDVRVSGRFLANNGDALRVLAVKGEGIILEPAFSVVDDLRAGRLVRLLPDHEVRQAAIHAVYPHSRLLSAKVKTFVDFLAARFGAGAAWDC